MCILGSWVNASDDMNTKNLRQNGLCMKVKAWFKSLQLTNKGRGELLKRVGRVVCCMTVEREFDGKEM